MEHSIIFYVILAFAEILLAVLAGVTAYINDLLREHEAYTAEGYDIDIIKLCSKTRAAALVLSGLYPALLATIIIYIFLRLISSSLSIESEVVYVASLVTGSVFALFPKKTYTILERWFPKLLDAGINRAAKKISDTVVQRDGK